MPDSPTGAPSPTRPSSPPPSDKIAEEHFADTGATFSAPERDDTPSADIMGAGSDSVVIPPEPPARQPTPPRQDVPPQPPLQKQQEQQKQQQKAPAPKQLQPPTRTPQKQQPATADKKQQLATADKAVAPPTKQPKPQQKPQQNPDRQMVTTGTSSAGTASSEMAQLNHQMAIAGTKAGFVTYRTASGDSLGSLGSYSKNWNLADTEVTSKLSEPNKLVAAPGTISRKLAVAKRVLQDASADTQEIGRAHV